MSASDTTLARGAAHDPAGEAGKAGEVGEAEEAGETGLPRGCVPPPANAVAMASSAPKPAGSSALARGLATGALPARPSLGGGFCVLGLKLRGDDGWELLGARTRPCAPPAARPSAAKGARPPPPSALPGPRGDDG